MTETQISMVSLWGDEFAIVDNTEAIIKKAKTPKKVEPVSTEKLIKSKSVDIGTKIEAIKTDVYKILGTYAEDTLVIKDYDSFKAYIDAILQNGIAAIDTETNNSLNTFDCKIMGLCLYTPGQKNAYIPVNHTDLSGEHRLPWQITEDQIREQLQRVVDAGVFEIFHNATFDIEVIQTTCGIRLKAAWDTMVGAQLLDENEHKSLKEQFKIHINPEQDKYSIEHLFKGTPYHIFDPELFALYAATDSYMTYKLFEYQRSEFRKHGMEDVYKLFREIEIPVIDAIVDMELTGTCIDIAYSNKMSIEYHKKSDEVQSRIDEELANLKPVIDKWRLSPEANAPVSKPKTTDPWQEMGMTEDEIAKSRKKSKAKSLNEKLADPIDLNSPTQMAILLYDILKVPVVDKTKPRGTGADILEELSSKYKICKLIVEKRGVDILINTFIDKMSQVVQKDGRVHARFNQCGTQTGRFSSSDPNLQNIPSHDKAIRLMFTPSPGYAIIGGDYSGQEPRSLCSFAQDKLMQEAYKEKKDLYAVIASKCFHNNYEDNLEFNPVTHELQPDGKKRRAKAKTVFLGVLYGMGPATLAERMGLSIDEAKQIISDFYKGFPAVDRFTKDSQEMVKKNGYVTDIFGRRRHLPDAALPEFEITPLKEVSDFNPLLNAVPHINASLDAKILEYKNRLARVTRKTDRDFIVKQAENDGLKVRNNGGFISRATRQTLNARIQGSAASMTKLAMAKIHDDPLMQSYGFRLLITVHDEIIGEAPAENADKAAQRLCELMVEAAKVKCSFTPWSVDPYIVYDGWYEDECGAEVLNDYNKLVEGNTDPTEAFAEVCVKYPMLNSDAIKLITTGNYNIGKDSLKYGPNYFGR